MKSVVVVVVVAGLLGCSPGTHASGGAPDAAADAAADAGIAPSDSELDAAPSPLAIALTLQATPAALLIPVTIGSSHFTAVVDTGSTGLRVADDLVAATDWTDTGDTTEVTFGFGGTVAGPVELATVTLGDGPQATTSAPIRVQSISSITCGSGVATCPTEATFEYGHGAIIGIGMRAATDGVDNPLRALTDGSYALQLPSAPTGSGAELLLDPADSERDRYEFVQLPAATGSAFDDRSLQVSVNGTAELPSIADTGTVDAIMPNVPPGIMTDPQTSDYDSGSSLTFAIALDDGPLQWSFVVGAMPVGGIDVVRSQFGSGAANPGGRSNLGLMPFFRWDVLYDLTAGKLGFAPKLTSS